MVMSDAFTVEPRVSANPALNWLIVSFPGVMFAIALSGKLKVIERSTSVDGAGVGAGVVAVEELLTDIAHPCRRKTMGTMSNTVHFLQARRLAIPPYQIKAIEP